MKILGISYTGYHDSAICLMEDGIIHYAVSEERISRISHDLAFPTKAIMHAFQYLNVKPEDIDIVSFSMPKPLTNLKSECRALLKSSPSLSECGRFLYSKAVSVKQRGGYNTFLANFGGHPKAAYCDHHLAHAISAYSCSGFREATIVIIDGKGSYEATSIWKGRDGRLIPVEIIPYPNSLGLFYAKFTKYLGFVPLSDEWKVMGLAAYGKEGVDLTDIIDTRDTIYRVNASAIDASDFLNVAGIEKHLGPRRRPDSEITDHHKDIAFAVQRETEKSVLALIEHAVRKTGCRNVCLAGGVALNCKANGLIAVSPNVDSIFVQPAAGDDGTAIGAAIYAHSLASKEPLPMVRQDHTYLGPIFDSDQIGSMLDKYKIPYRRLGDKAATTVAQLLASGHIIGLFQGRMEFGPRGLGNRSILADPRNVAMKDRVNESVKYRESWRPFAPSILEEYYQDFFDTKHDSPFMILSFPVKENCPHKIDAAIHVDNTARPQSVSKRTNSYYWDIIHAFHRITGVPAVLNTSFNLKGEPIVCSPFDAIRTFFTSGLDVLVLNDYLIEKGKSCAQRPE